jgi:pyruvate formate lyase activating enzyme
MMDIAAYIKTSLVDYEGHLCATIFTKGCNMSCDYCHNKALDGMEDLIAFEEVLDHLNKRKGVLTGVTFSGGEPTLQEDLMDAMRQVKALGYLVKLDTNGSRPEILKDLIHEGLVDYIAMDLKTSPKKYQHLTGIEFDSVKESIALIQSLPHYEFRTTMFPEVTFEDVEELIEMVGVAPYVLQQYRKNNAEDMTPYTDNLLKDFTSKHKLRLRGI